MPKYIIRYNGKLILNILKSSNYNYDDLFRKLYLLFRYICHLKICLEKLKSLFSFVRKIKEIFENEIGKSKIKSGIMRKLKFTFRNIIYMLYVLKVLYKSLSFIFIFPIR